MINPEQHAPETVPTPRSSADTFVDYCQQTAPTRRIAHTIRQLYQEHGAAFAAYLSLENVSTTSETLRDDYENAYAGAFFDEDTLVDNELDALGWANAVDQVIRELGIPEGVLTWDRDALLEQLHRYVYDLVDLDGFIYVFSK